jgi:hypothetical protein
MQRAFIATVAACLLAACGGGSGNSATQGPSLSLSADQTTVAYGANVALTWSASDATSCTASGDWSGAQATSGSTSFDDLTRNATYTLGCSGGDGSVTKTVTVTVGPALSLTANPTNVSYDGDSTLSWSSHNASSCTASGNWSGSESTSGSEVVHLTADASYSLTCTGPGGSTSQTVTITTAPAPPPAPPSIEMSAKPASVSYGGTSELSWSATHASSCTGSGSWSGSEPISGTQSTGSLRNSAKYGLTCTGPGGSASQSASVAVVPVGNLNLGGVWTVAAGAGAPSGINSGFLVTSPTGAFFYITYASDCTGLYYGTLSVSGSAPYSVTGNGSFAPDPWTANVGGCPISQAVTFDGTLTPGNNLQLSSAGTATFAWVFDSGWYDQPSAMDSIVGSWSEQTLGETVTLTVTADGSVYMQSPFDNCVLQGKAQLLNAAFNVYSFSFTYSGCVGGDAGLNGLSGTGLLTLDTGTSPVDLVMALEIPKPGESAYVLSGIFTQT